MKTRSFLSKLSARAKRIVNYFVLDKFCFPSNERFLNERFNGGRIFICIMHSQKTADRVAYLKKHYNNKVDFVFYSDYEQLDSNVLKVSFSNDYQSNELKHVNMLNLIKKSGIYKKYDFFYLADDDTYVQVDNLLKCTEKLNANEKFCMGELITQQGNPENQIFKKFPGLTYMAGGAGYILPSKVFNDTSFKVYFTGFADVTLGLNLQKRRDVKLINNNNFKSQDFNFYSLSQKEVNDIVSFHYIKTKAAFAKCESLTQNSTVIV